MPVNPRLYATEAVVLERRDFGEADRLLTLYTPIHGKVRAIAKGSRRTTSRISGHIELFTHTKLLIATGRNLDIVTQSELIRSHERLRDDLWRAALAYHVAELVNRFSEERLENHQVWRSLIEVLSELDGERCENPALAEMTVRFFELRLLDALGYRPELRICTGCGRPLEPIENYYEATSGGLLCPDRAENRGLLLPVSVDSLKVLRLLQEGDHQLAARVRLGAGSRRQMEQLLRRHIIHVLEHDLHAAHLVDEVRTG